MKFYVAVDCEGPACVIGKPGGTLTDSPNFEFARRQATREADAAARGLFDAGATQVIVWDAHGGGVNLHYDQLDRRCDVAAGSGFPHRLPGLDASFAGLLLVGYHAMDNTIDGVIAHTFSSKAYQWMKIDGREVGEMGVEAALAGELGVPLAFVASDDKAVAEAQQLVPDVQTVTTKVGYGWNAAVSKHPLRAADEIYEGAKAAARRAKEIKPYRVKTPLVLEVRHKRIETAEELSRRGRGWERVDAYTVKRTVAALRDVW